MRVNCAVVLLMLALVTVGCAQTGRPLAGGGGGVSDDPFSTSTDRPNRIRIEVRNLNFADARLYAIRDGGARMSLGSVTGKTDASFTLDWRLNQDIRIEINLLAGPTCMTRRIQVQPGDILELQIASVFSQSSFCR